MDAYLLRMFAPGLEYLLGGARIEKIQEFAPAHLGLTFYAQNLKRSLYVRFDRQQPFCFISSQRISACGKPSAQIMRFRKYFCGRKIAAVVVQVWSRKIWLLAQGTQNGKNVWLCLNLARGPELHFLDVSQSPEPESAIWPAREELAEALADWKNWSVLTPALRKTLAGLERPEQGALISDLADGGGDAFLYFEKDKLLKISAWPLPNPQPFREERREPSLELFEEAGFALVLDTLALRQQKAKAAPGAKRLKKISQVLEKIAQDRQRLATMQGRERDARLIQANLWRFPGNYHAEFINVETAGGLRKIILQKRFSLLENMERMFHEATRGKRGLLMLEERRAALEKEKNALQAGIIPMAKEAAERCLMPAEVNLPAHCACFISSDGYQLLRGKDAKGNLAIRRLASPHDLWVHVEHGTGAHVIIRRSHARDEVPERTLLEAGSLAANKSWLAGANVGPVMYAELRHIKPTRKGPTGTVIIDKIRETRIVPIDEGLEEKLGIKSGLPPA